MSLLKFLNLGRSLSATQSAPARYQYADKTLFRSLSKSSKDSTLRVKPALSLSAASSSSFHPPRLTEGSNSTAATSFHAFAGSPVEKPRRGISSAMSAVADLRGRLRLPVGGLRLRFPFKGAVKFHRPLVKIRLSLDGVAPVRNDLRDSDVEVLVRSQPNPFKSPPSRLPKLDTRELWNRLVSRALEMNARGA